MKSNEYKNSGRMSTMDQDKLSFNIFREKSKVFTKDCHREGLYTNQRQPSLKDQSVVTFETENVGLYWCQYHTMPNPLATLKGMMI